MLYVFIVLQHDRRQVIHFNVTANPYAQWTAQQIINAFPYEEAPRFLLRDRDGIYGNYFKDRMKGMGIAKSRLRRDRPGRIPTLKESLVPSVENA